MKDRILEFLRKENKTSAQFAEEIGVQPSGISHILSGRNKPSLDFVLKMLEKYQFLSTDWLLFGKGNMYKEKIIPDLFNQPSDTENTGKESDRDIFVEFNKTTEADYNTKKSENYDVSVEKIVWFYNNNSFREYYPEKE